MPTSPPRRFLASVPPLVFLCVCAGPAVRAQNYQSYMNSAERARESARYEAALLEGTYNNPMNRSGPSIGAEFRRRYEAQQQAEQAAREQAVRQREREALLQRQAEENRRIYLENREREEREERSRKELELAQKVMKMGRQNLAEYREVSNALLAVSAGRLEGIATPVLAATAYHLQDHADRTQTLGTPSGGAGASGAMKVAEAIARLADEALRRGEVLPAVLLASPRLRGDDNLKDLASFARSPGFSEGVLATIYYTGWWWPEEHELLIAEKHGRVIPGWRDTYAKTKARIGSWGSGGADDLEGTVSRILRGSRLLPWMAGKRRLSADTREDLEHLRSLNPALGHFVTALLEERLRTDQARPSPYADLLFEKAAQMAGPGFIRDFADFRKARLRAGDAKALADWRDYRLRGANPVELAALDEDALFRVAARLALNQDVSGVDPEFGTLADEAALLKFRRLQVHGILWDLTLKGSRPALAVQYLAAVQDQAARIPTLQSYLRAFRWTLGWDKGEGDFFELGVAAAAQLQAAPVTMQAPHYFGGPGMDMFDNPVKQEGEGPFRMVRVYAGLGTIETEADRRLPLAGALVPGMTLLRRPEAAENERVLAATRNRPDAGFAARLVLSQQVAWADRLGNKEFLAASLETLGALAGSGEESADRTAAEGAAGLGSLVLRLEREPELFDIRHVDLAGLNGDDELQFGQALRDCLLSARTFVRHPAGFPDLARVPRALLTPEVRAAAAAYSLSHYGTAGARDPARIPGEADNVRLLHAWLAEAARGGHAKARATLAERVLARDPAVASGAPQAAEARAWLEAAAAEGRPGALAALQARGAAPAGERLSEWLFRAADNGDAQAAAACLARDESAAAGPAKDAAAGSTPPAATTRPAAEALLRQARWIAASSADHAKEGRRRWIARFEAWAKTLSDQPTCFLDTEEARRHGTALAVALTELCVQANRNRQADKSASLALVWYDVQDDRVIARLRELPALLPSSPALARLRVALLESFPFRYEGDRARAAARPIENMPSGRLLDLRLADTLRWLTVLKEWEGQALAKELLHRLPDAVWTLPSWDDDALLQLLARHRKALFGSWNPEPLRLARLDRVHAFAGARFERLQPTQRRELLQTLALAVEDNLRSKAFLQAAGWKGLLRTIAPASAGDEHLRAPADRLRTACDPDADPIAFFKARLTAGSAAEAVGIIRAIDGYDLHAGAANLLRDWPGTPRDEGLAARALADDIRDHREAWAKRDGQPAALARALRGLAQAHFSGGEAAGKRLLTGLHLQAVAHALAPDPAAIEAWLRSIDTARLPPVTGDEELRTLFLALRQYAVEAKALAPLELLARIKEDLVEEEIDALKGFPKRRAWEEANARMDAMVDKAIDLLKDGKNAQLGARLAFFACRQGAHLHPRIHLIAAKALALSKDGVLHCAATPRLRRIQAGLLCEAIQSPTSDEDTDAALAALDTAARELWEDRTNWSRNDALALFWIARGYAFAPEKPAWALQAWKTVCADTSPAMRLVGMKSELKDPAMPKPPTPEELQSDPFVEAEKALGAALRIDDDPTAEIAALPR